MEEGGGDGGSGAPTAGHCLSLRGQPAGSWLKYKARWWWLGRGWRGIVGRRGEGEGWRRGGGEAEGRRVAVGSARGRFLGI